MEDLKDYEKLRGEEIWNIIYCLKNRKEMLENKIMFYNTMIKDSRPARLELLTNLLTGVNSEILKLDMAILKLEKLEDKIVKEKLNKEGD